MQVHSKQMPSADFPISACDMMWSGLRALMLALCLRGILLAFDYHYPHHDNDTDIIIYYYTCIIIYDNDNDTDSDNDNNNYDY